jgi:mitogen-activated protein kinase 15
VISALVEIFMYLSVFKICYLEKELDPVMTQYVAARWYRPPEVILGIEQYGYGVDIWGIGCVMAELILKRPLFLGINKIKVGNSTLDQL